MSASLSHRLRTVVAMVTLTASAAAQSAPSGTQSVRYPATRQVQQLDDYHGVKVADPYRWLESTDSPETGQWIEAQNALTFEYLGAIPEREHLKERLTKLWNYPK